MKVAIVHDYLREYGGAERVVEAIHEIWPEAPLFTSFVDWGNLGDQGYRFKNWDIRTSPLADNWLVRKFHSPLRFLAPLIWNSLDLSGYDVVISSSGWFMCRGVKVGRDPSTRFARSGRALHVCYIHHPPRNLYGYPTGSPQRNPFIRMYTTIINFFLRHYDYETAQKVDYFIANSEETKRRVRKFYRRESVVIYPPINSPQPPLKLRGGKGGVTRERSYFLSVGRLTYSKRVDLAIMACNKLKPSLKIVGTGKEEAYLRSIAGPTIEFLGSVSDEELGKLYAGAKALIFSALEEDFGMVPVEAMAHGTPVIALAQGGVKETVMDGKTGILFNEPTVECVIEAIKKLNNNYKSYNNYNDYKKIAKKFGGERFKREFKKFVASWSRSYLLGLA